VCAFVLFLARKNLFEQPFRLIVTLGGVGLAIMLMLVMSAILQGVIRQAGAFVKHTDAQVWVVQKGFTDIPHGFSVLDVSLRRRLERIPGVRDVNPLVGARSEIPVGGKKETLAIIGYDVRTGVGGPWQFATKPAVPRRGEIVVDETFARTAGIKVGDQLQLPDRARRVVALSSGTNQFVNQLGFARLDDMRHLVPLHGQVNFYALRVRSGDAARVRSRIDREFPGVTAFSKAAFVANNEREVRASFQPILYAMVMIAFLVGLAIIGLTIYTATVEKTQEYGVISAIGAHRGDLSRIVLQQSAITAFLGFVLGCLLVLPAGRLIDSFAPKTQLVYPLVLFPGVAVAALAMALVSAYVPIRRLARLDPAAVFRA